MTAASPPLFPLIRHVSTRFTPALVATPLTANQVTFASLVLGLGCNGLLMIGDKGWDVVAAVLLLLCYVLDNCDGEIARLKNQCSEFGMRFDSFVDWIVHSSFFPALGFGVTRTSGEEIWLWLGIAAGVGGTINYAIGWVIDARIRRQKGTAYDPTRRTSAEKAHMPQRWREWVVFFLRELTRADFCFIVLALSLSGVTWVLLPAGAIGAQVYWAMLFIRGVAEFHV